MSHEGLHEPEDRLPQSTLDGHRAIISLIEEFEAIDWYQQRADACGDTELRAILLHHMREETEHAAMLIEWWRRRTPGVDDILRTYLFTQGDITRLEEAVEGTLAEQAGQGVRRSSRMTVGDMKGV